MKNTGYILQYWLLNILGWWVKLLPEKAALNFGAGLGRLAYVLGIRRKVAMENLSRSFPMNDEPQNRRITLSLYRNLGMNLAELLNFKKWDGRQIKQKVRLNGTEHLDLALERGKGAILVSAHYGNWELYAAALARYDYPFSVVVYPQHNGYVDRMLNDLRRSQGVEVIYKKNAAREVLLALRRNRFVTMLADQDAGPDGVFIDFMGRKASVTKGPAVFAIKTGAPIITGAIIRQGGGMHQGFADPPLYAAENPDKEAEIARLTKTFTSKLEEYINSRPDHWYWVHKRWKTKQPAM